MGRYYLVQLFLLHGFTAASQGTTVDSLPLLGPSPKAPAIHFAFGGQHLGLTMGPRIGRMTADMIAGRKPNIDIAPYRVDRFDRH